MRSWEPKPAGRGGREAVSSRTPASLPPSKSATLERRWWLDSRVDRSPGWGRARPEARRAQEKARPPPGLLGAPRRMGKLVKEEVTRAAPTIKEGTPGGQPVLARCKLWLPRVAAQTTVPPPAVGLCRQGGRGPGGDWTGHRPQWQCGLSLPLLLVTLSAMSRWSKEALTTLSPLILGFPASRSESQMKLDCS